MNSVIIIWNESKLTTLIPEAINNWKSALILCKIKDIQEQLKKGNITETEALKQIQDLNQIRSQLAKYLGDRVVNPKI